MIKLHTILSHILLTACLLSSPQVFAQQDDLSHLDTVLLSQAEESYDTFDPFADYSEFDEASDEEADINFFRNGRFLTLAAAFGYRGFTDVLGTLYKPNFYFGGYLTYFFDLRLAIQFGYMTGDHGFTLETSEGPETATTTVSNTSFHLKYYLNTQNVTRGLAALNPYFIGGFSQVYRTTTYPNYDGIVRDAAIGFDGGAGIEIPILNHSAFVGLQALYQYVKFQDENVNITLRRRSDGQTVTTGIQPRGDLWMVNALLGINF